jgi:hypothetical protein
MVARVGRIFYCASCSFSVFFTAVAVFGISSEIVPADLIIIALGATAASWAFGRAGLYVFAGR